MVERAVNFEESADAVYYLAVFANDPAGVGRPYGDGDVAWL